MALSPGWPIIEAGMWLYREHYDQEPPKSNSVGWWLRWIGEVWTGPQTKDLRQRLGSEKNLYFYAFNMLAPRANELVIAEERMPASQQPEPDYTTHFAGKDALGWSIKPQDWPSIMTRVLNWTITQVRTGRLSIRYLDVALFETVQKGATKVALPIWLPPTGGAYPTDEESGVWTSYLRKTGYMDVQKALSREIMTELQRKKRDGARWLHFLDTADKVVGWASMTEPMRALLRKADELTAKYQEAQETIAQAKSTLAEVEGIDPAYGRKINELERAISKEAEPAFKVLDPVGMWQGEPPTQLGAVPIAAVYGGAALLAIGIVSVALISITSMVTDAQRTGSSIAREAKSILEQRIAATTDSFDREQGALKSQLITGEITQAQYDQKMIDINNRKQDAMAKLQREAERVQRNAPAGSIFGTMGIGAALAGLAVGAVLFRKQIARGIRR